MVTVTITRDEGYDEPLFVIERGVTLNTTGTTLILDGGKIEASSSLSFTEHTLVKQRRARFLRKSKIVQNISNPSSN